jgi:tetratricopeptide (TPR) repeat protein
MALFFFLLAILLPLPSHPTDLPQPSPPGDVELLVENADYCFRQALGNGPPKPSETLNESERELLAKAAAYWKRAIRLDPRRLDLRFNLARLYQALGDFEAQYAVLAQAVQFAEKNRKKMEWDQGEELPEPPSELFPEVLQECAVHYFDLKTPPGDEKALRLTRLSITYFPKHPYAYNSMAIYFFNRGDLPHALKYFLVANRKDPRDSLVLGNIACLLEWMGKKDEAGIFWRKVLELNNDPTLANQAKKQLKELEPGPETAENPKGKEN